MIIKGYKLQEDIKDILYRLQSETNLLKDIDDLGDNIMITCPVHKNGQENNPSCGVLREGKGSGKNRTNAGHVHCFTCGYSASLPEMISMIYGRDDKGEYGEMWILERFITLDKEHRKLVFNIERKTPEVLEEMKEITDEELKRYNYTHPYMYERGLTDQLIKLFNVGADPIEDCLVFPIKDMNGRNVYLQRRAVNSKKFKNDVGEKGRVLFGMYQIEHLIRSGLQFDALWVVESIFDAITCWRNNKPAVALLGVKASSTQLNLIKSCNIRNIVLALDNDPAGKVGKYELQQQLKYDKVLYEVKYPKGVKDINELNDDQFNNLELQRLNLFSFNRK